MLKEMVGKMSGECDFCSEHCLDCECTKVFEKRRRCYTCKCLEWESPNRFYKRIKDNPKARFYCKKCDPIREERLKPIREKQIKINKIKKNVKEFILNQPQEILIRKEIRKEIQKRSRRKYESTDRGKGIISINQYNTRRKSYDNAYQPQELSDEEKCAIGRFYRKCPIGCQIDHIILLKKGGLHELSNLQYLALTDHVKKTAIEKTKIEKLECKKTHPFTPTRRRFKEVFFSKKRSPYITKYNKMRRLVIK